jgi:dephospho-CoA kinase
MIVQGGPILLGVTGGMGTGKTTLCRFLAQAEGWPILEADRCGHEVLSSVPEVASRVIERFGRGIVGADGSIDRARLGHIVFSDAQALRDLNRLVHPWILDRIESQAEALRAAGVADIILLDAALLANWVGWMQRRWVIWTVVVATPILLRLQRLAGKGLARREAISRMRVQTIMIASPPRTRWAVVNKGSLDELRAQGTELGARLRMACKFWKEAGGALELEE